MTVDHKHSYIFCETNFIMLIGNVATVQHCEIISEKFNFLGILALPQACNANNSRLHICYCDFSKKLFLAYDT
jgi:hypothetical protein